MVSSGWSHLRRRVGVLVGTLAVVGSAGVVLAGPAAAEDHGFGQMGPAHPRILARSAVSPATGADFELPFPCGQTWTGSSRTGHSPSYYTIDFNSAGDFGKPVVASTRGTVTRVQTLTGSYGKNVVIDHGNGYSSLYGHLNGFEVSVGQTVDQGQIIGYLGTTGNSTGPHLHFEERLNGAYFPPYFHRTAFTINSTITSQNCADNPVAARWDNAGADRVGIFRMYSPADQTHERVAATSTTMATLGSPSDRYIAGRWTGATTATPGVRRLSSNIFVLAIPGQAAQSFAFGRVADQPIAGDWNGDGRTDVGVQRPSTNEFFLRLSAGGTQTIKYGNPGDVPIVGDWNGDKVSEVGVYRPSVGAFFLRTRTATGAFTTVGVQYGALGSMPVTGDWDGDHKTDVGVWNPATAYYSLRRGTTTETFKYGSAR